MRLFMGFVATALLFNGIVASVELRQLPWVIGSSCALMHLLAAFAFLLPVLAISGKYRIVAIVSVHLLACVYMEFMCDWLNQRQIDKISDSVVVEMADYPESDNLLRFRVRHSYLLVDFERKRALNPVYSLMLLDVVWLVWLLRAAMAANTSMAVAELRDLPLKGQAMWECSSCSESIEDDFDVCWKCGTSQSGEKDPNFRHVDDPNCPDPDCPIGRSV